MCLPSHTLGAVDGVDGLLPTGVLLGSSGQTVLLIQVELEPHDQSIQLPLLSDRQSDLLYLLGAQPFQFLQVTNTNIYSRDSGLVIGILA